MLRLPLTRDAVGPIARGHPWVYADGVTERGPVGQLAQLLDHRGRVVGFGLCDAGPIAVRVLGRHPLDLRRLLRERLAAALALRRSVVPPRTDAWRLVNGAGDGLPGLVVDRYGPLLVLRLYSRAWEPHLGLLTGSLAELELAPTLTRRLGVRRVDGDAGLVHLRGPDCPEVVVVEEAGLRFLVRPHDGQKTGLFLDQRENRRFVAGLAAGHDVLNLFAYTGGFSVHAAAAGARRVTTVDVSAPALADARENFRLNGLDPDAHVFLAEDIFRWTPDPGAPPDLVVCDPPSLSHGKQADRAAATAYRDLATRTGRMVAPGGLLASASCTARLTFEKWEGAVREGLRKAGRWSVLWRSAEPPDHPVAAEHPEGRYLKFATFAHRSEGR